MNVARRLVSGLLATGLLMPVLGGCSASTTPEAAQTSAESAALNDQFTELMPRLVEPASDAADMKYKRVREESCRGAKDDDPQTRTLWTGWAVGPVKDNTSANQALDTLDTQLAGDGWKKTNEVTADDDHPGSIRTLYYSKGDLGVTADLQRTADQSTLDIKATSGCADQPTSHRMQRSHLDPGGGKNDEYYDDAK